MIFALIIFLRVLFVTCMVFIIGYVFGSFSKNRTLTVLTKIAAILAIVLFVSTNILFFRFNSWRAGQHHPQQWERHCVQASPQQH